MHRSLSHDSMLPKQLLRGAALVGVVGSLAGQAGEATAQYDPTARKYPKALGEKSLALIAVNFDGQRQLPFSTEQMRQQTFEAPGSVADYYNRASFGQLILHGEVFGPVSLPARTIRAECDPASHVSVGKAANAVVEQQTGRTLDGFTNYGYTLPRSKATEGCDFGGWSSGNTFISLETRNKFGLVPQQFHTGNVVHELGHNFGLSHANSVRCHSAKGRAISFSVISFMSGLCEEVAYGDPIDPMGQGQLTTATPPDLSAINKARLGWLKSQNIKTMRGNGVITIAPLEAQTDKPQLVRVPNGQTINNQPHYFNLDFRQPVGLDIALPAQSPHVNGVAIRESGPITDKSAELLGSFTNFVDATPKTRSFHDGTLATGKTFKDSSTGITIKTLSVGPEGAVVRVSGLKHKRTK